MELTHANMPPMRFIDEAKIKISAGDGGHGCVAFRREKYVTHGGPSGGNGGRGGSISFVSSDRKSTLQDFRYQRTYRAENGQGGGNANKTGRSGEDLLIPVPVGTIIRGEATEELLFDFTEKNQKWTACSGGRGGKGNSHFASSTMQAPRFAQDGEAGEFKEIIMELKLLADVGIIGFPNAGKSTLISKISAAKPKIADYAFTTRSPNLGVVQLNEERSIVVADIPGLIKGASQGHGLGHRFLKHIERTEVLIHLIDGATLLKAFSKNPDTEAVANTALSLYLTIRQELSDFDAGLAQKPESVVINKKEILSPELLQAVQKKLRDNIHSIRKTHPLFGEPWAISGVTGEGLPGLLKHLDERFKTRDQKMNQSTSNTGVILPDGFRA